MANHASAPTANGKASTMIITVWVVQTPQEIHGPFDTAEEAGKYIGQASSCLGRPFSIAPVTKPYKIEDGK